MMAAARSLLVGVTLAFALRQDFPWRRLPGYLVAQLLGATLACLFLDVLFGNGHHLGATLPGPGYHVLQALLIELVLTLGLVSVILGTASAAQNVGAIAALGAPPKGTTVALHGQTEQLRITLASLREGLLLSVVVVLLLRALVTLVCRPEPSYS